MTRRDIVVSAVIYYSSQRLTDGSESSNKPGVMSITPKVQCEHTAKCEFNKRSCTNAESNTKFISHTRARTEVTEKQSKINKLSVQIRISFVSQHTVLV